MQLVPVVPIIFAPLLILVFAIVFPIWVVALAIVGLLRLIVWPFEILGRKQNIHFLVVIGDAMHKAWRWTFTFGGIAEKRGPRAPRGPGGPTGGGRAATV